MPTLTQTKRIAHPAKFARKDARTRVYRALYGSPSHPDSHGGPSANISRKLSEDWSYNQAESSFASLAQREVAREGKRVVESNGLLAPQTYTALVRRLEVLKSAKRHETRDHANEEG